MQLFAKGFRPFFLLGAAYAVVVVPAWLLVLRGTWAVGGPLSGPVWHAHEMVHGFTAAILAGFLLTAVGNWTGRETVIGPPLAGLAAVWVAGRVALWTVPGWAGSIVDLAFLPLVILGVSGPLWASRHRRDAAFPVLLAALWAANLATHLHAHGVWPGAAIPAGRFAIHVVAVVILVITGRIVPMFTRNATGAEVATDRVADATALIATGVVAGTQLVPVPPVETVAAAIGACAVLARARRWGFRRAVGDPLLWVLHLGHAFVAVGLALEAAAAWVPGARSSGLHAIAVGSIGMLTLGMMARVALGHTGRPLRVPRVVGAAFGAVLLAALARVVGPLVAPAQAVHAWWTAGTLWTVAFAAYLAVYTPILGGPRADGRPG